MIYKTPQKKTPTKYPKKKRINNITNTYDKNTIPIFVSRMCNTSMIYNDITNNNKLKEQTIKKLKKQQALKI